MKSAVGKALQAAEQRTKEATAEELPPTAPSAAAQPLPTEPPPPTQQRILTHEQERLAGREESITPLVSSTKQTRRLLTAFEQATTRPATASGAPPMAGSRVFSVPKRHYKEALLDYDKALAYAQERSLTLSLVEVPEALHPEVARLLRAGIPPKEMRHPSCATRSTTSLSWVAFSPLPLAGREAPLHDFAWPAR